jgi:hypothetical protein
MVLVLWWSGCCRVFCDGDMYNAVFRWWHPFTWLLWLISLIVGGLIGVSVFEIVPLWLSPYWRDRRRDVVWWSPWTHNIAYRLSSQPISTQRGKGR